MLLNSSLKLPSENVSLEFSIRFGMLCILGLGEWLAWAFPGYMPSTGMPVLWTTNNAGEQENVCDCQIRAVAFWGADVLFPKCPLFSCISMHYLPCSICFMCPSPIFLLEKVSFLFWNWKLKPTVWKRFSLHLCSIFHIYTLLVHSREPYLNASLFPFIAWTCLSEFILVIWISHESRQHLTFRNHNHRGLVMITPLWSVCVHACVCIKGGHKRVGAPSTSTK